MLCFAFWKLDDKSPRQLGKMRFQLSKALAKGLLSSPSPQQLSATHAVDTPATLSLTLGRTSITAV